MSSARKYARNLVINWSGHVVSLVVMFFMSPFVVSRLGDLNYGVWSLMTSIMGPAGRREGQHA